MISFLFMISLNLLFAGQDAGSGGDTVECAPAPENNFNGTFALDYLLTYKESNKNADIVAIRSLEESLQRIKKNLDEKLPELNESFNEFIKLIRSEDVSLPRFWEEAPFGLVDIKDENIINLVPMNCRHNGQVKIVQAVIRLNPLKTGTKNYKLVYKYVPILFQRLYKSDPLQLSFLLIHEWLWDLSHNVDRNRRLNRIFHSQEFDSLPREALRMKLTTLGLEIPKVVAPPEMHFDSCPADSASAKTLMSRINQPDPVVISKDLNVLRRTQRCHVDDVDGCLQSTASFIDFSSDFDLKGVTKSNGEKLLVFHSQLFGPRSCTVDDTQAKISCFKLPESYYGALDWFLPSGTIGKGCIRLYDSMFMPSELNEIVLTVKF